MPTLPTLALLALAATSGAAQSLPPVTRAKQVAEKAVAATNAQTAAMTAMPADSVQAADSARAGTSRTTRTAAGSADVAPAAAAPLLEREVFRYERSARRDPFVSLMASGDLRPVITDLRVSVIVHDPGGRNSVAVIRDMSTKEQYRVRVGSSLGRVRVSRIDPKSVTFTIEEFGYSRQETLGLGDPNKERSQ
jgi:hypothetical protein